MGEYNVEQKWKDHDGCGHHWYHHICRVVDKRDVEGSGKNKICWIRGDEDGGRDVCNCELCMDPCSRVFDVVGYSGHVGQERRARKNYGVVTDEASQGEEEGVEVEK